MKIEKMNIGVFDGEFITVDEKIWLYKSYYPIDIAKSLLPSERLYLVNNRIAKYCYEQGDRKVIIYIPKFWKKVTISDAIKFLRELAKMFIEAYPDAKEIVTSDEKNSTPIIDGEHYSYDAISSKTIVENGKVRLIEMVADPALSDKYEKFARMLNEKVGQHKWLFVVGKYAIENSDRSITNIYNVTEEPGEDTYFPIMKDKNSFGKIDINGLYVIAPRKENVKFISPMHVPNNAFIISTEPNYIQFTKTGIAVTNGIFFINGELEEVTYPWYVVRKEDNGWIIYLNTSSPFDGVYRIHDNMLEKLSGNNNSLSNEGSTSIVYRHGSFVVKKCGDELCAPFQESVKINSIENRIPIKIDNKQLSIPEVLVKKLVPPIFLIFILLINIVSILS